MTHSIGMIYDSEYAKANELLNKLRDQFYNTSMNPQDLVDRIIEAFQRIGLVVDVKTWSTGQVDGHHPITGEELLTEDVGRYAFDVELIGRVERHEFDHDKMATEVQRNILGLENDGPGQIHAPANMDEIVKRYTKGHTC